MSEEKEKKKFEFEINTIELRSEDVQEILGFIPHWIIRWGISLFFTVILVILLGSMVFKYPDIIPSTIVVTTKNPPAALMALNSGKIAFLFVKDNEPVKKDDYIAIIENTVNHRHLSVLRSQLNELKALFASAGAPRFPVFDPNYSLGELQSAYASFLKSYTDYRHFMERAFHQKKMASLKDQIEKYQEVQGQLIRQLGILSEELTLSKEQYERAKSLFTEGILSQNDLDSTRGAYLQKEYSYEGAKTSLANSKIQIDALQQAILDLDSQYKEQDDLLFSGLKLSYETFLGQISQWEQHYVLKSPIDGLVSFTRFWSENQNVKVGDTVVTVVPEKTTEIIGKLILPVAGSGKVKVGQAVNVKLANYPFMDFGIVQGIIKSKSLITADNNYHLEVQFPHGLKTNYGKTLEFNQEMQGTAEIITDDVRMLERIFKPIKSLLKRNSGE